MRLAPTNDNSSTTPLEPVGNSRVLFVDDEALMRRGIGLAIVDRVVRECGGRGWVESSPGRGSAFFVQLENAPTSDDA